MFLSGHIEPFWANEYTKLEYTRNSFNNQYDIDKWIDDGYTNKYFTGKMHVANFHATNWTNLFFNLFPSTHTGVTFYKMETGIIMPTHKDTFKFFIEKNNIIDCSKIRRALIFLENWKSGHIFEIENTAVTNWQAGDYVVWNIDTPHLAANIGVENRYTAQITYLDV